MGKSKSSRRAKNSPAPVAGVVLVHGGAGNRLVHELAPVLRAAAEVAWAELDSPSRAVTRAVQILEDSPLTNAGMGSVPTTAGHVEMDAAVMIPQKFGAVACLRGVKNPVLVAHHVLLDSPHCLLVGDGARAFARQHGIAIGGTKGVEAALERIAQVRAERSGEHSLETVGTIVLNPAGELGAASSTGGIAGQAPGRVGDTPIPGAGIYCGDDIAVLATGKGEAVIEMMSAMRIVELYRSGKSLKTALTMAAKELYAAKKAYVGFLAATRAGDFEAVHTSATMPYLALVAGAPSPHTPTRIKV